MIKVTTIDNPEYQEFETWAAFLRTNQILHSHNDKPSATSYYIISKMRYDHWYLNGRQHRSNSKPSCISYLESGEIFDKCWHLDGRRYSEQDYKQIMKQIESMSDTERLLDSRWWVREMAK